MDKNQDEKQLEIVENSFSEDFLILMMTLEM